MFDLYTRVFCSISRTQSCKCTVLKLKEVSRPCGFSLGKVHTEQIHCTVSMVFLETCVELTEGGRAVFFVFCEIWWAIQIHGVEVMFNRHFTDYSYIYTFSRHSYPKQLKKVNKRNSSKICQSNLSKKLRQESVLLLLVPTGRLGVEIF